MRNIQRNQSFSFFQTKRNSLMNEQNAIKFELDDELLASHGQRFANYLIDYICQVGMMFGIFMVVVMVAISNGNKEIISEIEAVSDVVKYAFVSAIVLVYYNVMEVSFSVTIGKLVTGTLVVDRNGNKPSTDEILVRSICRLIPFEILSFIGPSGRGWHDTISKNYVVKRSVLENRQRLAAPKMNPES